VRHDGDRRHHWSLGLGFNTLVAFALATHMWLIFMKPSWPNLITLAKGMAAWGMCVPVPLAIIAFQPFNAPMRRVARPFLLAAILMVPIGAWLHSL
jgi:hypothetical protein